MTPGFVKEFSLRLPEWIEREIDLEARRPTDEARMALAVELAERNVAHGGGPFGAAIVEAATGRVIAVGANWVVSQGSSLLHAEITAIALAQARLASYTLAAGDYELFASSEPCAQCLGATVWSGVRRLVCGAPASEAEAIGFDEGPRRDDWVSALEARGIRVTLGLSAPRAGAVLRNYAARGGAIYNPKGS
ncbi:MAG TPA: nucleoside deaminase [Polyangiaceae bacterium]